MMRAWSWLKVTLVDQIWAIEVVKIIMVINTGFLKNVFMSPHQQSKKGRGEAEGHLASKCRRMIKL